MSYFKWLYQVQNLTFCFYVLLCLPFMCESFKLWSIDVGKCLIWCFTKVLADLTLLTPVLIFNMHIIKIAVSILVLSVGESLNCNLFLQEKFLTCNWEQLVGVEMVNAFLIVFTLLGWNSFLCLCQCGHSHLITEQAILVFNYVADHVCCYAQFLIIKFFFLF
jgi:hypothetical protein